MRYERALVVLKNYLGDTVMASPLVRSVNSESRELSILGSAVLEQILRYPDLDAIFADPGNLARPSNLFRQASNLRKRKINAAFLVNRSFRSALLVRVAGIPVRVGHDTEGRGPLLTHRVKYEPNRNEALCYLDLARAAGFEPTHSRPELWLSENERLRGQELVGQATVGLQPGARHDYKQIPIHIQTEMVRRIRELGQEIAYFGGKEERPLLEQLPPPAADLVGNTSIRETVAGLANLRLMIGGDTGVMHLAAAAGTPTLTTFGPTPAKKWGWFEAPHQVVQAPGGDISRLDPGDMIAGIERVLCESS